MMRWFWKRWVWAGVFGTTLVVGLAAAQKGGDAPTGVPKVGDVISLKFANGPDRQVKVIKSEKQPDGSYLSEVKDTKTGETFSLLDRPGDAMPPAGSKNGTARTAAGSEFPKTNAPKSGTRPADPLLPSATGAMPAEPKKEKERRFFPGVSVFSPRPQSQSSGASPLTSAPPAPQPAEEEKPGLLKRIFGSKKTPAPNAMPATTMPAATTGKRPSTGPAFIPNPGSNAAVPPPVRPTPYVAQPEPAVRPDPVARPAASGSAAPPLFPTGTPEPPRSRVSDPLAPPTAVIPVPVRPPTAPPSSSPAPLPLPGTTAPGEPPVSARPRVAPPEGVPIPAPPVIVPAPAPKPAVNPPTAPMTSKPAPSPEVSKPTPLPEVSKPAPLPVTSVPAPSKPEPLPVPSTPSVPVPSTSVPTIPSAPAIPSVPSAPPVSAPAPGGLPTIPVPPGGLSAGKPAVVPAAFAGTAMPPAKPEMVEDILPQVNMLRSAEAPSKRALAARALAGGRHGSGATAKSVLFGAAQDDPCSLVRAVCIEELCKLGHQDAAFLAFLKKACDDPSAEVSAAAKDAMAKMTPRK